MTLALVFGLCMVAMSQMPLRQQWLLVAWLTVVMSAVALATT